MQFTCLAAVMVGSGVLGESASAASDFVDHDFSCQSLSLDSGPVSKALEQFSLQTEISIVVDHRLIEGLEAPALSSASSCGVALQEVLSNSELMVEQINDSTIAILRPPEPTISIPTRGPSSDLEAPSMQGEIIVVTGSRLLSSGLHEFGPVLSVAGDQFRANGVTRAEDLLNAYPTVFSGQTGNIGNGATGTSSLDLRSLGSVRTLVLIDGKRLPYGSPRFASANLDLVPPQLVERVDIVTGGASAVYGSDAVAGVANFIMRRDFEGIEIDGQVGVYQDSNDNEFANALLGLSGISSPVGGLDGRNVVASVIFGANSPNDRGNVTAFVGYQSQTEIRHDARDYSTCAFGPANPGPRSIGGVGCAGSSTFRRFVAGGNNLFLAEDGQFVPYISAPEQTFNFAPDNFIQRPIERLSMNAFARYEISNSVEAYLDAAYSQNHTSAQIASSGSFFRPFSVNCDNPFLGGLVPGGDTFAEAIGCDASAVASGIDVPLLFGYRNVSGDPRSTTNEFDTIRTVGGLRGQIGDGWHWDAFGQFSRSSNVSISRGDLNFSRLQDALFVINDGSTPKCRSDSPACIPFNVFQRGSAGETLVSREAAISVQQLTHRTGSTEQKVVGASLQNDLGQYGFQSPWADHDIQALFGVEWREDSLDSIIDDSSQNPAGAATGLNSLQLPVKGAVSVWELFTETQIPLIERRGGSEELSISGAYRFSNYNARGNGESNSFDAHTFSAGVVWSPVSDLRIRGQFQRAVRAPNVLELFTGVTTGTFAVAPLSNGLYDPCAGDLDPTTSLPEPAASASQCAFTGLPSGQYGSVPASGVGQLNSVVGGNSQLTPERADTYTLGAVYAPLFIPNFMMSVDYFDISVNDAVGNVPPNLAMSACLEGGDPEFCNLINRDQFGSLFLSPTTPDGGLAGVSSANVNVAQMVSRGLDFSANYSFDLGDAGLGNFGTVDLILASTYSLENSFAISRSAMEALECSGYFAGGCPVPISKYRHRLISTWSTPWGVDFNLTWRHLSQVENIRYAGAEDSVRESARDATLGAANYVDIGAYWYLRENVIFRAGVRNLLGRDPELQMSGGAPNANGNTFPGTYDPTGRYMFFGMTLRG